jgi:hypothetical protein
MVFKGHLLLKTQNNKTLVWGNVDMLLADFSPDSTFGVKSVEWGRHLQKTKGTWEKNLVQKYRKLH